MRFFIQRRNITIRNEYENVDTLYGGVEGFIALVIPHIMFTGDTLIVKDKVCLEFYNNLLSLKDYYKSCNVCKIYFNVECESYYKLNDTFWKSNNRGILSTFTGGVDSFYTVLTNLDQINGLMYCVNYDVREKHEKLLKRQLTTVREVSDKLGKKCIICWSNQRDVLERDPTLGYMRAVYGCDDIWGRYFHGPAIFSCAYNLSKEFGKILIPSSYHGEFDKKRKIWGSNFTIDPKYSSPIMNIVHDGDCTRIHKIKTIIQLNKKLVFDYLKVCYSNGSQQKYNCSKCEKCQRTFIPIGIMNVDYIKELKTFDIDVDNFIEIRNKYLQSDFYRGMEREFQIEARNLACETCGCEQCRKMIDC